MLRRRSAVTFVAHLFEVHIGDLPQHAFHRVGPLPLTQRILLSADDVDVVRDVIRCVVSRLPLALTLEPGVDVGWRTGIACELRENWLAVSLLLPSWFKVRWNLKS